MTDRGEVVRLDEFLRQRRARRCRCKLSELPADILQQVREAVAEHRAAGKSPPWAHISEWLVAIGHAVPEWTVRQHFTRGHEER